MTDVWSLTNVYSKKRIKLDKAVVKAGRNRYDEIVCFSKLVSRNHAHFVILPEGLHVQDNKSSNGTFVNKKRIKPNILHRIKDGDEVGLGFCQQNDDKSLAPPHYVFQVTHYKVSVGKTSTQDLILVLNDSDDENVSASECNSGIKTRNVAMAEDEELQIAVNGKKNNVVVRDNLFGIGKQRPIAKMNHTENEDEGYDDEAGMVSDKTDERDKAHLAINVIDKNTEEVAKVVNKEEVLLPIVVDSSLKDADMKLNKQKALKCRTNDAKDDKTKKRKLCASTPKETKIAKTLIQIEPTPAVTIAKEAEEKKEEVQLQLDCYSQHDEESFIEIGDDEDNDEHLLCSQLYKSTTEGQVPVEPRLDNDMFAQIKQELEQMDRLNEPSCVATVDLESNLESDDWLQSFFYQEDVAENEENLRAEDESPRVSTRNMTFKAPPIVEPHVMVPKVVEPHVMLPKVVEKQKTQKKQKTPVKRKSRCQEPKPDPKRPKISNNFNYARTDKKGIDLELKRRRSSPVAGTSKVVKTAIHEVRKQKLKEIAMKSPPQHQSKAQVGIVSKVTPTALVAPKTHTSKPNVIQQQVHTFDIVVHILSWPSCWLDEQLKSKNPPPVNKKPAVAMRNSFSNYAEYYDVITPLLTLELWNSICREYEKVTEANRENLLVSTMSHGNINKEQGVIEIECLKYLIKDDKTHLLKEEDLVLIQIPVMNGVKVVYKKLFGYVSRTKKQQIYPKERMNPLLPLPQTAHTKFIFTVCVKSFQEKIKYDKVIYLRLITSITSHLRIFKSVKHLRHSPLCRHILNPALEDYKVEKLAFSKLKSLDNLNATQKKIVLEAATVCVQDKPGVYLIKGPPGTGKSTVIINIIQQILLGEHTRGRNTCLLLVAPSNAAIDELTLRIVKKLRPTLTENEKKNLKLIRVGPKDMINPDVRCYAAHEIAKRNVLNEYIRKKQRNHLVFINEIARVRELIQKTGTQKSKELNRQLHEATAKLETFLKSRSWGEYNAKFKQAESDLLTGANIICTTLSSCLRLSIEDCFRSLPNRNTCVIVDEATQSQEPETLIPLILGINKLVLVGDPQQLPATTISLPAKNLGYGQSLFSRLQEQLNSFGNNNPIQMLTSQYRMHPEICRYPNYAFYDNKLQNSTTYRQKRGLNKLNPYVVINVNITSSNASYYNEYEVECVVHLVEAVLRVVNLSCNFSMGIITPYNNQREAIYKRIKAKNFSTTVSIVVNTVDSFQGQEKDVIIMSCVRSASNNFLADEKRLNVALTRARSALYVVGTYSLFSSCYVFRKLRADAEMRNVVVNLAGATTADTFLGLIARKTNHAK